MQPKIRWCFSHDTLSQTHVVLIVWRGKKRLFRATRSRSVMNCDWFLNDGTCAMRGNTKKVMGEVRRLIGERLAKRYAGVS